MMYICLKRKEKSINGLLDGLEDLILLFDTMDGMGDNVAIQMFQEEKVDGISG